MVAGNGYDGDSHIEHEAREDFIQERNCFCGRNRPVIDVACHEHCLSSRFLGQVDDLLEHDPLILGQMGSEEQSAQMPVRGMYEAHGSFSCRPFVWDGPRCAQPILPFENLVYINLV
jgi:hypothetical protein